MTDNAMTITPSAADAVSRTDHAAPMPAAADVVRFLRTRFGDQYRESYEHGRREFVDALVKEFGLSEDAALDTVEAFERSETIRFHREAVDRDVEGPRVGLLDPPRSGLDSPRQQEYAGHYWELGRDEPLPGTP